MATLSPEKIDKIEAIARSDLGKLKVKGRYNLPVPLDALAELHDLKIMEYSFKDEDVAGILSVPDKVIIVSSDDTSSRQAFTIAHEVGHMALGHGKEVETLYRKNLYDDPNGLPSQETEANWYAASVLMPEDEVRNRWAKKEYTIGSMAEVFGVSSMAMEIRLKHLHLI